VSKERVQYRCRVCGGVTPRWAGRCGQCGDWDALEEEVSGGLPPLAPVSSSPPPMLLSELPESDRPAVPTGLGELDRVLGGGLLPSSVTLVAGEPGIGKSTLLLQALSSVARSGRRALLISAEESPGQVRMRAERLGVVGDGVCVAADTDLAAIRSSIEEVAPDVMVIDSIQTVGDRSGGFAAGSAQTVRLAAQQLAEDARRRGTAVVLVGHVTKDGSIAGPRVLEHLVDTVISFEGDRHHALRTLRAVKHRFGPVGELGLWEMTDRGLVEVADGTSFLLADRRPETPGSCIYAGLEGRRALLVEVQALVLVDGSGHRTSTKVESSRLDQLLAVLDRRAGVSVRGVDVYVSAVGGVRLAEPGVDLALAAAIYSSLSGRYVPDDIVVMGEVGLGGELRQVAQAGRRLAEAARMGFKRAVVPAGTDPGSGIDLIACQRVDQALAHIVSGPSVAAPVLRVVRPGGF
jgi:DNA repair protein RadA/Sms